LISDLFHRGISKAWESHWADEWGLIPTGADPKSNFVIENGK
jgi:hypothetical protein